MNEENLSSSTSKACGETDKPSRERRSEKVGKDEPDTGSPGAGNVTVTDSSSDLQMPQPAQNLSPALAEEQQQWEAGRECELWVGNEAFFIGMGQAKRLAELHSSVVSSLQAELLKRWPKDAQDHYELMEAAYGRLRVEHESLQAENRSLLARLEQAKGLIKPFAEARGTMPNLFSKLRYIDFDMARMFLENDAPSVLELNENQSAAHPLSKENEELKAWKESAMTVLNQLDLQELGRLMELPLGSDVSPRVVPFIASLRARLEQAEKLLAGVIPLLPHTKTSLNIATFLAQRGIKS